MRKLFKVIRNILIIVLFLVLLFYLYSIVTRDPVEEAKRVPDVYSLDGISMVAKTGTRYFEIYKNDQWEKIFLKGTNLGSATPGKWFTEFPADRELYMMWLNDISKMNLNMIRLYTLFDPAFYQVLKDFNENPENEPIYFIQEIWPDDFVPGCNFHNEAYKDGYKEEVRIVIDALHGNLEEMGRPFRAYGNYSADVSPYLLGVLIGREFEPEEVENTNRKSPEFTSFLGEYIYIEEGTPTEIWLAELCDYALEYASNTYRWQYPVGFVSWPTLDPLTHPTEREPLDISAIPAYNDREEIVPARFKIGNSNIAGFFGAYHIYPNYPDFMNNEPGFANFSDNQGIFRYKGYLSDFMDVHPSYPAIVAEFGISTSLNTAHINPDGLNHGGISEKEQGPMIKRMVDAIVEQEYGGAIIFAWADEWAKKTWNTEPYMAPWDRNVLWKNMMDPEQNYGVVAVEPDHIPFTGSSYVKTEYLEQSDTLGNIHSLELDADEAFFYLAVNMRNVPKKDNIIDWDKISIYIALDTIKRDLGEFSLPVNSPKLGSGVEFLVKIESPDNAKIQVIPPYNRAKYSFMSKILDKGIFEDMIAVVNRERITLDGRKFPALLSNQSILNYGKFNPFEDDYFSLAHWYYESHNERVVMRLPWMLIGVTDPSSAIVAYDERKFLKDPDSANFLTAFERCTEEIPDFRPEVAEKIDDWNRLSHVQTDGFMVYVATISDNTLSYQPRAGDAFIEADLYRWQLWEVPSYRYRYKDSFLLLADYFAGIRMP